MLGPPKLRCLDRPVTVSLEDLVPANHCYRHLDAKLDLSFVREWAEECYAERGRPSIDPVVFFRLQLIMFFEGIRSERQLMETASLHLAHRWYLGYALDEPLPDHSSLTRIRQRLGLPIFRRFFEQVVQLCLDAGLVWGKELFFDGTKVRANAAMDSLVPRLQTVVDEHVVEVFGTPATGADDEAVGPAPVEAPQAPQRDASSEPMRLHRVVCDQQGITAPERWDLLQQCRLDPARPASGSYQRQSDRLVSRTDPDAVPMKTAGQRASLGYHDHYVVDGGRDRIILHALVTPADVMDNEPMLDQLWRVMFRWRVRPERVVADTRYATIENIQALEDAGIRAYVPLADWDRTAYYGISQFTYDADHDVYHCPQGHTLSRYTTKYTEQAVVYRAKPATCNACPVKAACTASERGRTIQRPFGAEYLERVRGYHDTEAYKKAMRKRKVWPEPLFGEAKQWHGLRQFRLRGLANVNMEGLLIAAGQNLKRWLMATGWGRRHGPAGSLGAAIPAFSPSFTVW
jgi:transposase